MEAHDLYTEGHNAHEFVRTVSRLIEMRTRDYLAEPHRTEPCPALPRRALPRGSMRA